MAANHTTPIGGAPRRRRALAALGLDSDGGKDSKRGRIVDGRLILVALAGALLLLFVSVSSSGNASQGAGLDRKLRMAHDATDKLLHIEGDGSKSGAGKRHRKLERGKRAEQQQLKAAGVEDDEDAPPGTLPNQVAKLAAEQGDNEAADDELEDESAEEGGAAEDTAADDGEAAGGMDLDEDEEEEAELDAEMQRKNAAAEAAEDAAADDEEGEEEEGDEDDGGVAAAAKSAAAKSKGAHAGLKSPYHQALEGCETLTCLRDAARKERHEGQFLFPHFIIIGWQKSATTSLFHHLLLHPNVSCPEEKEPEFFTDDCGFDPEACPRDKQKQYIKTTLHLDRVLDNGLYEAAFEGSTHYAREGPRIAEGVARTFPWARIIASMRDPISRAISMLAHNLDKRSIGCLARREVYHCLKADLPELNYTTPFTAWVEAFPREQVMLLQFEALTDEGKEAAHLREVKSFLGLDPKLPHDKLYHRNTREERLGHKPEGWPIKRGQYQELVDLVRPDAESIAKIVDEYGFGDGRKWLRNWERAWQANLDGCDEDGNCVIELT